MIAALEGGEWSAAHPGRTLPPGKIRYPFYRRLGGPQGRSGRAENLVPTGIRFRTVQHVVSRYTDWATRPTLCESTEENQGKLLELSSITIKEGHMAHTGRKKKYRVLVGKYEESSFGDGNIIWTWKRMSAERINLAQKRKTAGSYVHADVSSGCIKRS